MGKAATFRQQVRLFADRTLSPAARSALLAAEAKRRLADLIESGRASPGYRRFVDGVEGAREEQAQRVIVYEFSRTGEAAEYALGFLRGRSPSESGRFRDSFVASVDGSRPIAAASFDPAKVPPGAEVAILNTRPYGRKIDVQVAGGRRLRFSVPEGLYEDAARAVRRRFGNAVSARRVYTLRFPGQYTLRGGKRAGTRVETPALIIRTVE